MKGLLAAPFEADAEEARRRFAEWWKRETPAGQSGTPAPEIARIEAVWLPVFGFEAKGHATRRQQQEGWSLFKDKSKRESLSRRHYPGSNEDEQGSGLFYGGHAFRRQFVHEVLHSEDVDALMHSAQQFSGRMLQLKDGTPVDVDAWAISERFAFDKVSEGWEVAEWRRLRHDVIAAEADDVADVDAALRTEARRVDFHLHCSDIVSDRVYFPMFVIDFKTTLGGDEYFRAFVGGTAGGAVAGITRHHSKLSVAKQMWGKSWPWLMLVGAGGPGMYAAVTQFAVLPPVALSLTGLAGFSAWRFSKEASRARAESFRQWHVESEWEKGAHSDDDLREWRYRRSEEWGERRSRRTTRRASSSTASDGSSKSQSDARDSKARSQSSSSKSSSSAGRKSSSHSSDASWRSRRTSRAQQQSQSTQQQAHKKAPGSKKPPPVKRLDYYAVLGIKNGGSHTSEEDIKLAFRREAFKYHSDTRDPDLDSSAADERMRWVLDAYRQLRNRDRK